MTRATRHRLRAALRRIGDALLWTALGALIAPTVFALGVGLFSVAHDADAPAVGVALFVLAFSTLATFMFAVAPYAALLVGWAFVAPRLGDCDRSRARVALATCALAVPAGAFMVLANDGPSLTIFAPIWLAAWTGLLVPRLVVPRLAPGAFARRDVAPAE